MIDKATGNRLSTSKMRQTGAARLGVLYTRAPEHDKRIARGDDFAGDAWRDREAGVILWVAVGHDPNALHQAASGSESAYAVVSGD